MKSQDKEASEEKGKGAIIIFFFELILIFPERRSHPSSMPSQNVTGLRCHWCLSIAPSPLPAPASAFFQLTSHVPCSECQRSYKETAIRRGDCQEREPSALSVCLPGCLPVFISGLFHFSDGVPSSLPSCSPLPQPPQKGTGVKCMLRNKLSLNAKSHPN